MVITQRQQRMNNSLFRIASGRRHYGEGMNKEQWWGPTSSNPPMHAPQTLSQQALDCESGVFQIDFASSPPTYSTNIIEIVWEVDHFHIQIIWWDIKICSPINELIIDRNCSFFKLTPKLFTVVRTQCKRLVTNGAFRFIDLRNLPFWFLCSGTAWLFHFCLIWH